MGTAGTPRCNHGNADKSEVLPRVIPSGKGDDTYGVTTEMGTAICSNTAETCPYIHLRINLVLYDWMYA